MQARWLSVLDIVSEPMDRSSDTPTRQRKERGFRPNLTGSSGELVDSGCVGETTSTSSKGDSHDDVDERCLAICQREARKCRCSVICYRDSCSWRNASCCRIGRACAALVFDADVSVCRATLYDASPSYGRWRVAVRGLCSACWLCGWRAESYPLQVLIGRKCN